MVALVVENVEKLMVLNDHDAATVGKFVQLKRSGDIFHLFDSVLVHELEGASLFSDNEDLIGD